MLHALLEWAAARGAMRSYLAVMETNGTARALYESSGYATAYRYRYRYRYRAKRRQ